MKWVAPIVAVVTLVATPVAAHPTGSCRPIPGAETLWRNPATRFIMVGETHGSVETPAIFGDLVCAAAVAVRRPVIVAIEHPAREQRALDAFMRSSGDIRDQNALRAHYPWTNGFADGRTSESYFALIEYLRVLRAKHRIARVVAIDPEGVQDRDAGMARNLLAASRAIRSSLTLVLAGNFHTAKVPPFPNVAPGAASMLPRDATVSLVVAMGNGTIWNCQPNCGLHRTMAMGHFARGVIMGTAWLSGHDGTLATGTATTPSPPAVWPDQL
ncbi:MAG: hypothetical protein JSR60_19965 [Proteobacteria bacterium]|nr:hypothetical protein [Pseudomonadota bacterium]